MRKLNSIAMIAAIFISISVTNGFSFKLGGKEMARNGTGRRTMFIVGTVYFSTLYVTKELKGKSAKEIIEADEPASVIMKINTGFVTRERFIKTTREGFAKAAKAGYPAAKSEQLLNLFDANIKVEKYDVIYLIYIPGKGVVAKYKPKATGKVRTLGIVGGLQLKKALLAMWIGPNPVQESCKRGMLGR